MALQQIARWIHAYWGKARPGALETHPWHPLAWHSLDVAAAMLAILEMRPALLVAVAKAAGFSVEETRRRLMLVAAFHDLGKFAENFQQKAPGIFHELNPEAGAFTSPSGHGDMGAVIWQAGLNEGLFPDDTVFFALGSWLLAAVAHHGSPVKQAMDTYEGAASPMAVRDAFAFTMAVMELIGAPSDEEPAKDSCWLVAGLVILADWIGSNKDWFPYTTSEMSLEDYWERAQQQAREAVTKARLAEAMIAVDFDLDMLLGPDAKPSPLQAWAAAQEPQGCRHLYIIEDLTGAGKTEAALILAHRLMRAGAAEGFYWALPTTATANGLYARLQGRYRHLFASDGDPSLVLSHGSADIHDGFQGSIATTYGDAADGQDITAEAHCAAFFAEERKKAFLAQAGVGTLDQAILGVLPVRHQSLRLAALARRVLIIDEAHAYDPYTSLAMERLLAFHAAHGGSAIILSATLTQAQRAKLIATYSRTAKGKIAQTAFPLATHVSGDALAETPINPFRGTRRDLPFRRFYAPEAAMAALLERAKAGHCGVYVRNTVHDAMAAYEHLKAEAPEGVHVDLFHARYTVGDRAGRETEVLARFGKDSTPETRRGQILVATQVVESSLDLDFDFMVSDLCPMDLLIQRAGRLQRHDRPGRPAPELWVVAPPATDDVQPDWYAAAFPKGQYVYPDPGQLWRTLKVLTEAGGLKLESGSPRDLIEPVFGTDPMDAPSALYRASSLAEMKRDTERAVARLNVLKIDRFEHDDSWGSEIHTPTRLGEETLMVRLARWDRGVLTPWCDHPEEDRAWRLSEIRLETRRIDQTLAPDPAAAEAIATVQSRWPDRHEPPMVLVLTPTAAADVWEGRWRDRKGAVIETRYSTTMGLMH